MVRNLYIPLNIMDILTQRIMEGLIIVVLYIVSGDLEGDPGKVIVNSEDV